MPTSNHAETEEGTPRGLKRAAWVRKELDLESDHRVYVLFGIRVGLQQMKKYEVEISLAFRIADVGVGNNQPTLAIFLIGYGPVAGEIEEVARIRQLAQLLGAQVSFQTSQR